jgi:hypothetical protein
MKKLLVVLILVLAVSTGYSQKQFRVIYNEVALTDKDQKVIRKFGENTIFFNYGNEPIVKIYLNDGSTRVFTQLTDSAEGKTEGGMEFTYAEYEENSEHFHVLLQLFTEKKYGARLVFEGGQTIQFIP